MFSWTKMGIKKFTSSFIKPLPDCATLALVHVSATFIDGNQFVYSVIEMLKKASSKKSDNLYVLEKLPGDFRFDGTSTEEIFWQLVEHFTIRVVEKELIEPLKCFANLKHITFCLDGTPCAGKLLQQWIRRKNPTYFAVSLNLGNDANSQDSRTILSDAMILAGSRLLSLFGQTVLKGFTSCFPRLSMEFSLDNVPGEGEHKMLDHFRHSTFATQNGGCLIWSNDSDVPVCLLSAITPHNTFIRTTMTEFIRPEESQGTVVESIQINEPKIYRLDDLRNIFCADVKDYANCQLFISFFGNDFLPEMLNTCNLAKSYKAFRMASMPKTDATPSSTSIGKKLSLLDKDGFFDAKAFLAWLNNFDDFAFYFEPYHSYVVKTTPKKDNPYATVQTGGTTRKLFQFEDFIAKDNKLAFKHFYLMNVLALEHHLPQSNNDIKRIDDKKLFAFEMEMALDFLKVYIWYLYYINGWYLPLSENEMGTCLCRSVEPFYRFNFPPLFNSLKKLLTNPDMKLENGECLNDILKIKPRRRNLAYWGSLARYPNPLVQAFTVLQHHDTLSMNLTTNILKAREDIEHLYSHQPTKSLFVKTRLSEKDQDGKIVNIGTKPYLRPNMPLVMAKIADALNVHLTSEQISTITVGQVGHVELCETRSRLFALDQEELIL